MSAHAPRLPFRHLAFLLALPAGAGAQDSHMHHAGPAAIAAVTPAVAPAPAMHHIVVPVLQRPPVIDGTVKPGEWAAAARLTGFTQLEPREGAPAGDSTVVLVARDDRALYVAFIAYDADVARVRATRTPRDKIDAAGDYVGIALDPLQGRTRAYFFAFNPLGVQYDGIWSQQLDFGWDGVLASQGTVSDNRYTVEAAIPFATLGTGSGTHPTWDVDFVRFAARSGEEAWWAPRTRAQRNMLAEFGQLDGMPAGAHVPRVEVIPTVTSQSTPNESGGRSLDSRWGATLSLPVAPSARLEGTYRPDFSYVESDEAQIAFNQRYALFYQEKRPFFLESADQFATPAASYDSDPLTLVHTRTIVQPRYGARALFTPQNAFVGTMVVAQDHADGTPDGSSAIGRALQTWHDGSQVGVLGTWRGYQQGQYNTVVAGDAVVHLPASTVVTAQLARSVTRDSVGARQFGTAGYVDLARDDGRGFQQVVYRRIPETFDTRLGFIPRADLQQVVSHLGQYWRPSVPGILYVLPMLQYTGSWTIAGHRSDAEWLPHAEAKLTRKSSVWVGYRFGAEEYRGTQHQAARIEAKLRSSPAPWLDLAAGGKLGTRLRYDTDADATDLTFVAPSREVNASADFRFGRGGSVIALAERRWLGGNGLPDARAVPPRTLWLGRVRAAWQFDNATYVRAVAQYDPDLDRRTASLLVGRELNYGTQAHVGVEQGSGGNIAAAGIVPYFNGPLVFLRLSYLFRP